ncbi:MAG: hypothetical protein JST45_00430, partial [Bacteroidetes bacterium]|nr:hypothetical protein [Bacteroidota bacterium]
MSVRSTFTFTGILLLSAAIGQSQADQHLREVQAQYAALQAQLEQMRGHVEKAKL